MEQSHSEIKGKENIKFIQKNGELRLVEEVYYISEIKSNILSVDQLMEFFFEIFMNKRTLYLKDNRGKTIVRVEMGKNRTYKLDLQKNREEISQDQQGRRSLIMAYEVRTFGIQWPQRFGEETVGARTTESRLRE
jgi:predicted nucleic acid-binding protein